MAGLRGLRDTPVLLTGGASGIGRAIALRLGEEGARVGVLDLDAEGAKTTANAIAGGGSSAWPFAVDIVDFAAVAAAVDDFAAQAGPIRGLVNCAGWDHAANFLDTGPDLWRKVIDINLVSTRFKTGDNQLIIVPNGKVWGDVIQNVTVQEKRRVDLVFGIGYDDDIDKAERILTEIVESHPKVLADPAPSVRLSELADSSVNFVVRPWTRTSDHWDVRCDITRSVKKRFDEEGITIPYPQTEVHLRPIKD